MNTKLTLATAANSNLITQEKKFQTLGSIGFVRGVTALDQWYLLVNDAWNQSRLPQNEMVRDYLVTMLHRHMTNVDLIERLSAFSYAEYLLGKRKVDDLCAHEVADMCLQCAAFFPTRSTARHEMKSYGYVIDIGVSMYRQLARQSVGKDDWYSLAFQAVADSFGQAILILRSACPKIVFRASQYSGWKQESVEIPTDNQVHKMTVTMNGIGQLLFKNDHLPTAQTKQ